MRPRPIHYLMLIYGALLSILSVNKVFQFNTQSYDMAIFQQLFWNTLHGRFMFTMPECCYPVHPPNFLGAHFSPLILLLLPLYAIYQSPYTLLVIQSFALAIPVVFVYKMASKALGRGAIWTVVAAYLFFPGVLWPALSDFHIEAFVPLAYIMMFYFWEDGRLIPFVLSYLFLLSTFEDSAAIGLAFLLYAWLKTRKFHGANKINFRILALLGLISVAWFAGASYVIQSTWPQRGLYLKSHWDLSNLGVGLFPKAQYWLALLIPLAFTPLFSPLELIPAAPWFAASVFSNFAIFYTLPWQYSALVVGPLIIATIFALQRLERLKLHRAIIALTLVGLVTLSPFGAYSSATQPTFFPTLPSENAYAGHQALSLIPPNATVLAQDNILPFLVDRQASVFSHYVTNGSPPSYIAVDLSTVFYFQHDPLDNPIQFQVAYFLSHYSYGLVASADGFLVYQLDYSGKPMIFVPYSFHVPTSEFKALVPSSPGSTGILVSPNFQGRAWSGPWVSLGPGVYRITFLVNNLSPNSAITFDAYYANTTSTFVQKRATFTNVGTGNATLDAVLTGIVSEMEFRGIVGPNQSANLYFEGIEVTQLSAG